MTKVAAVVVTHDAQRWLPALLDSVQDQTRTLDDLVVVDDASTDASVDLARSAGARVVRAHTDPRDRTARDRVTRIAANFVQGVRACVDADIVLLADHDDVWHRDRVERQEALLRAAPRALMVASDGRLVDQNGAPTGGTLRTAFPLPAGWSDRSPAQQMAGALRASVATGGASAIRPAAFEDLSVPAGWLHDRWWSLVALARTGLLVDDRAVIDYRVQAGQQVGLDRAAQGRGSTVGRAAALAEDARRSVRKAIDLRRRLRPLAVDDQVAAAISLRNAL